MERIIVNLSDSEALAASQNRLKVLVRPLREQPPYDWMKPDTPTSLHPDEIFFYGRNGNHTETCTIRKRLPIGSVLWMRETWYLDRYTDDDGIEHADYLYKASDGSQVLGWLSPARMPSDAIRHKPVVKSNRVCLARQLQLIEIYNAGIIVPQEAWEMPKPCIDCDAELKACFTRRYPSLPFEATYVEIIGF